MPHEFDLVEGHRGTLNKNGWESAELIARFYEIDSATPLTEVVNDVPDIGTEHPYIDTLFLSSIEAGAISNNALDVSLTYQKKEVADPNFEQIRVSSTLVQQSINTDVNGDLMTVEYTKDSVTKIQPGIISALFPQTVIEIRRRELGSPGAKEKLYAGKVNSTSWTVDPTANAHEWMCMSISGDSSDGGIYYDVIYSFQFNKKTWKAEIAYIFPDTGRPPDDVVIGTGVKTFQIYEEIDFNNLNLLQPQT